MFQTLGVVVKIIKVNKSEVHGTEFIQNCL